MDKPPEPQLTGQEAWDHIATQAIRGPLSWIITQLDAIDTDINSQISPASKKALANARSASRRLLDMLESLLASQRITAGLEQSAPQPVSLTAALEPVVKQLTARAQAEGKGYVFNAEGLGLAAAANEDLLRRAVRLVSNRGLDEAQKGGNVRATASAMTGGFIRLRIVATPPAEDSGQVGQIVPAEIGFARMAVEQMGGKFSSLRTQEGGMLVDIALPTPAAAPPRPPEPATLPAAGVTTVTNAAPEAAPQPAGDSEPPAPPKFVIERPTPMVGGGDRPVKGPAPAEAAPSRPAAPEPETESEEPKIVPPKESGFKITREVTFDWEGDK